MNRLARLWTWFRRTLIGSLAVGLWRVAARPAVHIPLGILVVGGFAWGILFWGGLHTGIRYTNTEDFCISCHEMRDNVYQSLQRSAHHVNATGVRAVCSDCHVPHDWSDMILRKVKASREVWVTLIGEIDTKQSFEAKRLELAKSVWARMKRMDSETCRTCHDEEAMDLIAQNQRAQSVHARFLFTDAYTCIDCHKGIVHQLPDMSEVATSWTVPPELRGRGDY